MTKPEPETTAALLLTMGVLMGVSALFSRASGRFGVPVAMLFLGIGVLAGSEGIGGIDFFDYATTYRIGTAALVVILFDGGLNTPIAAVKQGVRPAAVLATLGVVATALLVAGCAWFLGFQWTEAMLLGAIVSSTDAAAVFSVLRGSGIHIKKRVGATLELESGLNDPMAVLLTVALTHSLMSGKALDWHLGVDVVRELALGSGFGWLVGRIGVMLLTRVPLSAGGLYPVLTLALASVSFGAATLIHGSGFLAVYVTAVMLGNARVPYHSGILRVHDAIAWLAQVLMFLLFGLLAFPSRLYDVAVPGLMLGLYLATVARPLAVFACLLPFSMQWRERVYISWVGLRGAVPIVLATFPVMANAPGALKIFDVVFFVVVVNAIIPGSTIRWATDRLGLKSNEPPPPPVALEVSSTRLLSGNVLAFHVERASAATGVSIADLPFPSGASVMLIVRGDELVAPRGNVVLEAGDHLYVITRPEDEPLVQLMFGGRQEL